MTLSISSVFQSILPNQHPGWDIVRTRWSFLAHPYWFECLSSPVQRLCAAVRPCWSFISLDTCSANQRVFIWIRSRAIRRKWIASFGLPATIKSGLGANSTSTSSVICSELLATSLPLQWRCPASDVFNSNGTLSSFPRRPWSGLYKQRLANEDDSC